MPSKPLRPSSHLRRLALVAAIVGSLFAVVPGTASAATCWRELVNDYWADNRVDRVYPISCYREAMEKLPRDVQEYSDAQDDLRRALLLAIREERDSGTAVWREDQDGDGKPDEDVVAAPPSDDDNASTGFIGEVLSKLGPKNADSIPVPLLVLGAIALLLIGAAGVSYLTRYYQARRVPVTAGPAPPSDPRV
jgi:hypothetical protein